MSEISHRDRVWEIVDKAGICMMVTRFADGLRARPLEARPDKHEGLIWFITDVRGTKDDEIAAHHEICLTFISPEDKAYLSISGRAETLRDTGKAEELWNKTQTAWWPDGPSDPNVRVIRFEPERAELWDGPKSSAVAAYEFRKARATGEPPDLGENRKSTVEMG